MNFDEEIIIQGRKVGRNFSPFIIAEAGVAHFGSLEKAFRLCDLAKEAGADSVKFQIFNVEKLISSVSTDWKNRLGPRQMSADDYEKVQNYCNEIGLIFFATAHDEESLNHLVDLNVPVLKVGSGEKGNFKFLKKVITYNLPVIISTGMYSEAEVAELVSFLRVQKKRDVIILHCVTEYPAAPVTINLRSLNWLSEKFKILSGYSDHTAGHHIASVSAAMGATVIEKHISLDFNVPNAQDWKVSCGPHDLKVFVENVRDIYSALGKVGKFVTDDEAKNSKWATKGVYASKDLEPNHILSITDFELKRPANGIKPQDFEKLIGKRVNKKIINDCSINWEDLNEG